MCDLIALFRNSHHTEMALPCDRVLDVEVKLKELFPEGDEQGWPSGALQMDLWGGFTGPNWLRLEDVSYLKVRYCDVRLQEKESERGL